MTQAVTMDTRQIFYLHVLFFMVAQTVHASWWYLGISSTTYTTVLTSPKINFRSKCSKIDVLDENQRKLCTKSKNILDVLRDGAAMGIDECQFQFRHRRWNCTTFNETSVFGNILKKKSREKAYIYAISTAGIMHSVTRACSKGYLHICTCDQKIRRTEPKGKFIWGGCSDNIRYGSKFTRQFTDQRESLGSDEGLMNLWNNGAGRRAIKKSMKLLCKCHGVSGSCSVKICWRTMATFRMVGAVLKERFEGAAKMKLSPRKKRLKPYARSQKKPTRGDLVYLEDSPNFCEYNPDLGILGTKGRECNKTSYGLDGCLLMCCGRGYQTMVTEIEEDCDCKFFWCCRVECRKCKRVINRHFCN